MPGTEPGGGKVANSRSRVSAALRGKDCVIYWKGGAKALKKEMNSSWKNVEQSWGIRDREPLQGLKFSKVLSNYVIHKNHTV